MSFLFHFVWTPIAVFLVGYVLLRIMGKKKAVAEMSSFDLLVTLILSTTITEPIVTKRLGVATYFAVAIALIYLFFSSLSLKSKFKRILTGSPIVLVRNGDIDERGLKQAKLNTDQLLGELRVKGYTNVADLAIVLIEETGQISAIPKSDKRPIQPSDLNITPSPMYMPIPIIIDGEIVEHNLKYIDKDLDWLSNQLQSYNMSKENIEAITLATLNQKGFLNIDTTARNKTNNGIYNYKPGDNN